MKKYSLFCLIIVLGMIVSACRLGGSGSNTNTPTVATCGVEQCHGLEVTCGSNVPEMCTAIYQLGDFCHQYINCRVENGSCQMADTAKFDQCKTCVEKCQQVGNIDAFACEEQCRAELSQN